MYELKQIDGKAHQYVVDSKPELWANSIFTYPRYDVLTSNTSEVFNACVGEEIRYFPVLLLVHDIICRVARKIYKRNLFSREIVEEKASIFPHARGKVQENSSFGRKMDALRSGDYKFLVTSGSREYNWDTSARSSTCGHWRQLGYPYSHACTALLFAQPELDMELHSHVSYYFKSSNYRMFYSGKILIHALPDPKIEVLDDADMSFSWTRQPGLPS